MIPPVPGPEPASRLFGYATPPDGAGPIGPDGAWPQPAAFTPAEARAALNPLHHLPVVGTIYRAVTGEVIPPPLRVAGAALFGGPLGALGAAVFGLVEQLAGMAPDLSRPAVPAGMSETGSEAGVQPVPPGTAADGAYTTLATATPEFLALPVAVADAAGQTSPGQARAAAVAYAACGEWERACRVEKGIA